MLAGRLEDSLQRPHDGGMRRLIKCRDAWVTAVDRQKILDEVIGTHTEEVDFEREVLRHRSDRGNLNHGAQTNTLHGHDTFGG